jgi:hypothetical protein
MYQNVGKEKQKSTCFGIFCKNRLCPSYELYKNKGNTASVPSTYSPPKERLRNILSTDFNWEDNCFICGKEGDEMKEKKFKKHLRKKIHHVTNAVFKETVLSILISGTKKYIVNGAHS